jgi:hypothetical protein
MPDNIAVLPGVERRDLLGETEPSVILQATIDKGITDVIVIGKQRDGEFYLAAADGNADAVVGKLFYAAQWLAGLNVKKASNNG